MITQDQLNDFFSWNRENHGSGRSHFNIDEECRWSYFFIDSDREKLLPIADHLAPDYE